MGLSLSPQAWFVGISLLVIQVIFVIVSIVYKAFSLGSIISVLLAVLFIILIMFDTNCLGAQDCSIWSWVRSILYVTFAIISVILTIWVYQTANKIQKDLNAAAAASATQQSIQQPTQPVLKTQSTSQATQPKKVAPTTATTTKKVTDAETTEAYVNAAGYPATIETSYMAI